MKLIAIFLLFFQLIFVFVNGQFNDPCGCCGDNTICEYDCSCNNLYWNCWENCGSETDDSALPGCVFNCSVAQGGLFPNVYSCADTCVKNSSCWYECTQSMVQNFTTTYNVGKSSKVSVTSPQQTVNCDSSVSYVKSCIKVAGISCPSSTYNCGVTDWDCILSACPKATVALPCMISCCTYNYDIQITNNDRDTMYCLGKGCSYNSTACWYDCYDEIESKLTNECNIHGQ